jgi:hypothetical protein
MADPITATFVGLKAASSFADGLQGRAKNLNEAAKADAQARLADTQALQRDTAARDDLARFLSSVQASRAANGLSARSPNAQVLERDTVSRADDDRLRQRADDRQRAANFRAAGKSFRSAARMSLITGTMKAGASIAGGMM